MPLTEGQQAIVLDLARRFVRAAFAGRTIGPPEEMDAALREPAGCFVSLHTLAGRRLRGCVGRIDASQPLIEALRSASAHVLHDPRFAQCPVTFEELPLLEIEVSVLAPPRAAMGIFDFDPLQDGIYLTFGARSGCFLPQVGRETRWSREELLNRLCVEKLGLPHTTWRHPYAKLHVFSVLVIGPAPFETAAAAEIGKQPTGA
jgi:AmmeMemoRadiSam system protein A